MSQNLLIYSFVPFIVMRMSKGHIQIATYVSLRKRAA